jgi:hypothetical protein
LGNGSKNFRIERDLDLKLHTIVFTPIEKIYSKHVEKIEVEKNGKRIIGMG